jgi:hypothetical protein
MKFIVGHSSKDVFLAMHEAGVFADDPDLVRRVVIDLESGSPARVYIERYLDEASVDVILGVVIQVATHERKE